MPPDPYAEIRERLGHGEPRTVTALPDGSVDTYYAVSDPGGERLATRAAFAERVAEAKTLSLRSLASEPGGQAVNMARQADALGEVVTLCGYLDDPVFEGLPFETVSMGTPSAVSVYDFADGDLMLAADRAVAGWSLDALEAALGGAFVPRLSSDAVCCGNWISIDGMTPALEELGRREIDGGVFVFDPGDIVSVSPSRVRDLFDALGALDGTYDVVASLNDDEAVAAADALGIDDGGPERVAALRGAAGVTAVVVHGVDRAVGATGDGPVVVENLAVEARRQTGAGDRFGAGLAFALAREWPLSLALALGNACASYYVERAETATREDLRAFLA